MAAGPSTPPPAYAKPPRAEPPAGDPSAHPHSVSRASAVACAPCLVVAAILFVVVILAAVWYFVYGARATGPQTTRTSARATNDAPAPANPRPRHTPQYSPPATIAAGQGQLIYWDLFIAEERADWEAEHLYPTLWSMFPDDMPSSEWYKIASQNEPLQFAEYRYRTERYSGAVRAHYGITQEQQYAILNRAYEEGWAKPPFTPPDAEAPPPWSDRDIEVRARALIADPKLPAP